jgi:hypothetical protein
MLSVSGRWAPAHRVNHHPVYRVELWRGDTRQLASVAVESASINKDMGSAPRTTATVTVADTTPAIAPLLTPFNGNRLKLYAGIVYPDNVPETILIADLDIVRSSFNRPDSTFTLECADPSARIAGDTLPAPSALASISAQDAIANLIRRTAFHGTHALSDGTGAARPLSLDWQADGNPWDAAEQLTDSLGADLYFTPARIPVLRPLPTLKATPDATLYALADGTVTMIDSVLERCPNTVYVWGAPDPGTGKQSRGLAMDTNPASPTYVYSGYGRVVQIEDRPTPMSTAQAQAAAQALLQRIRGRTRTVTLQAVPDPALEPGDTVQIRFAGGALEMHLIQSIDIPFGGEASMSITTRTTAYTTAAWP